jgi:KDO2-lipid IV(A) lauroyltransferase
VSITDTLVYGSARLLLALLRALPRPLALRWMGGLGRTWARLGGPRTDVAAINLAIAFPDESPASRRRILIESFAVLAESVVDAAAIATLNDETSRQLVEVEGLEHLEGALAEGRGVILPTAHFGSFELFQTACAARGIPASVVHREQDNAGFQRLLDEWRTGAGVEMLPRGSAVRGVLRALRRGRVVGMPVDQDTPRKEGIFVPFFGRPACTQSAPARIAMKTGAPVVPGFLFRSADGVGRVVRFYPPLEMVPAGDDRDAAVIENVRRMTAAVEEAVRTAPDHWYWVHRRWRTDPQRGVNIYKPSKSR